MNDADELAVDGIISTHTSRVRKGRDLEILNITITVLVGEKSSL